MGLLIPTLKWTGLNSSLMISLCVSLSCSLSFSHARIHAHKKKKNRTFKSDLLARRFAHKQVKTDWAAKNKPISTNRKQLEWLQRRHRTLCQLAWVSLFELSLQQQQKKKKSHHESLVEQRRQVQVEMEGMEGAFWRTRAGCGVEPERAK